MSRPDVQGVLWVEPAAGGVHLVAVTGAHGFMVPAGYPGVVSLWYWAAFVMELSPGATVYFSTGPEVIA